MIKLIVFDIDGVITDGTLTIDRNGNELKCMNLKDIDAIFELHRRGFLLAAITGENTDIVDYFEKRFPWDLFYRGNKTKKETLKQIEEQLGISREDICYVGDGKYDVESLDYAGLSICPADAIDRAKQAADIILQQNGGGGCIWELVRILENYNTPQSPYRYLNDRLEEHTELFKKMASDQEIANTLIACGNELIKIFNHQGQLFLCGNGGSAADAQHIATEFVSRFYKERKGLSAEALSTNTSTLTAVGNDYSFERVFSRQIEAKGRKGDMLIGISTSGKSRNVLQALESAKEIGMSTMLLMGDFHTDIVEDFVDYLIKVPSTITPRIQEAHIFLGHTLAEYVEHEIFKS